ncbi:MAG: adaptor protein MecA [Lachnospiraceae bacterium]|nr:adaptor protein MecA [Lachnospiraceae bacterium]MCD7840989.1 adaptor protein MecA [Lachnospiraceae bacterium]
MKIEKINDRQIRCTLTSEDLASRNINVKDMAYGSDKARELFQDMMMVAEQDLGFEAENIPLVIEAIPVSMDTIILIITKVEDPEELDTRFSRFSPEAAGADTGLSLADLKERIEGADDILDLIRRISEGRRQTSQKSTASDESSGSSPDLTSSDSGELPNLMRAYSFQTLDDAIRAALAVNSSVYDGPNSLYKSQEDGVFYLMVKKAQSSPEQFNRVCNILSEYAVPCKFTVGMDAYFNEHFEMIVAEHALQNLREIG